MVIGVAASYQVCVASYRAFDAVLTSLGWAAWDQSTAIWWAAVLIPLALLAVVSAGIFAAIAILIRGFRPSRWVGPFLLGYGALLAAGWLRTVIGILVTGDYNPGPFALGVWAAFAALTAGGALLVYRGYRHRSTHELG